MMTPSTTISQAISMMPLEKSSRVSVGRRHCGKVCGITPLVYAKGGTIYTKRDEDYWTAGGIQEVRKRSRGDDTTSLP